MSIKESDVLALIPTYSGKKKAPSVPTDEILELEFGGGPAAFPADISDALDSLDEKARDLYKKQGYSKDIPSKDSLNNCHGKWSEALFAISAWNTLADINSRSDIDCYVYVKLPPKKSKKTEWLSLLNEECSKAIKNFDLDSSNPIVKKSSHKKLTLIASNPDAVLLKFPKKDLQGLALPLDPCSKINNFDVATLSSLANLYSHFYNRVTPSKNLVSFISLKTSTRPDRRFQFLDEGNHVKSVMMYLYAMKADKGLLPEYFTNRYFALCLTKVTESDRDTMDCAMSAYVSAPIITPLWSVDKLYETLSFSDISDHIKDILDLAKY